MLEKSQDIFTKKRYLACLVCISILMILVSFVSFGVADNGDFTRYFGYYVERPLGMAVNWPPHGTEEWKARFFLEPVRFWDEAKTQSVTIPWFTSAHITWQIGKWLNNAVRGDGVVDILLISFPLLTIHILSYLYLCKFSLRNTSSSSPIILLSFLFSDGLFIAYYNSFFAEGLAFLCTLIVTGVFAVHLYRPVPNGNFRIYVWICLGLTLLICISKRQYAYFLCISLIYATYLYLTDKKSKFRLARGIGAFVLFSLATIASLWLGRSGNPQELAAARVTSYHSIYYGILTHSSAPEQLLEKLNLPASSKPLIGSPAFNEQSMALIEQQSNLSLRLVFRAILHEPKAYARLLLANSQFLGDFSSELGLVFGKQKGSIPPMLHPLSYYFTSIRGTAIIILTVISGLYLVFRAALNKRENSGIAYFFVMIYFSVCVLDIVGTTFDGKQEVSKHLLLGSLHSLALITVSIFIMLQDCYHYAYKGLRAQTRS